MWQDEWCGLTIEDIRKLEEETQRILARKMGALSDHVITKSPSQDHDSDQEVGFASDKSRGSVVYVQENNNSTKLQLLSKSSLDESEGNVSPSPVAITVEKFGYDEDDPCKVLRDKLNRRLSYGLECNGVGPKDMSSTSDSFAGRELSQADLMKGWRMSTIETAESDSGDDEFFDAQGNSHGLCSRTLLLLIVKRSQKLTNAQTERFFFSLLMLCFYLFIFYD